jgi:acyl-CoA thioesterase I
LADCLGGTGGERKGVRRDPCYGVSCRRFQVGLRNVLALLVACLFGAPLAAAEPFRIVAFGDSLSAGFNLPANAAFPAQLEKRLRADGFDAVLVNASVSGDTSAGGLARLDFSLGDKADLVILELGANDMLRGVDPSVTRNNLEEIIGRIESRGAKTMLAGMRASGNFGPAYKQRFDAIYPDLAARHDLPLYPFFMEGVAGEKSLTLGDGLHPTEAGVAHVVNGVAPLVEKLLAEMRGRK